VVFRWTDAVVWSITAPGDIRHIFRSEVVERRKEVMRLCHADASRPHCAFQRPRCIHDPSLGAESSGARYGSESRLCSRSLVADPVKAVRRTREVAAAEFQLHLRQHSIDDRWLKRTTGAKLKRLVHLVRDDERHLDIDLFVKEISRERLDLRPEACARPESLDPVFDA